MSVAILVMALTAALVFGTPSPANTGLGGPSKSQTLSPASMTATPPPDNTVLGGPG